MMMFPVKYVTLVRWPGLIRANKSMDFRGSGMVHLLETGLVLEGLLPRVHLPFLATLQYGVSSELLCRHTIRTIPYSLIQGHEWTGIPQSHLLLFSTLIDVWQWKGDKVAFQLRD